MAVSISAYNHTTKLFFNKEVSFTSLRVVLLSSSAAYTASHTSRASVENGTTATFTITIAAPGVVTANSHGLANNTPVVLNSTGALPTGLTAGTVYYVRNAAANTFELSATSGGGSITTSGSQSGTHTFWSQGTYEVNGNGWDPLGEAISNVAVTTVTTNDSMIDADDLTVTASGGGIGPTRYAEIVDWSTGKPLFFIDYGQSETAGDGTDFKFVWAATGIALLSNAA